MPSRFKKTMIVKKKRRKNTKEKQPRIQPQNNWGGMYFPLDGVQRFAWLVTSILRGIKPIKKKRRKRYDIDIQSSEGVVMIAGLNKRDREIESERVREKRGGDALTKKMSGRPWRVGGTRH